MTELQGSPIEVPKMVDGEPKCGEGYKLKVSDAYYAQEDEINKKNASRKSKKNGFIAGLIVFLLLSIVIVLRYRMLTSITETNNYGSKLYFRMSWEEIGEKMKENKKTFIFLGIFFLGSLAGVGTMSWKIHTSESKDSSPKLTEKDYFCEKIPEPEPEPEPEDDSGGGSSSNGFHVQSRRRRRSSW